MSGKRVRLIKDFYDVDEGAWYIRPDCDCGGLYVQAVDLPDEGCLKFQFDGDEVNPTFSPSLKPFCQAKGGRCHFCVRGGVAEHCSDSRFPNEKRALQYIDTGAEPNGHCSGVKVTK